MTRTLHIMLYLLLVLSSMLTMTSGCRGYCVEQYTGLESNADDGILVTIESQNYNGTWEESADIRVYYWAKYERLVIVMTIANASCVDGYVSLELVKKGNLPVDAYSIEVSNVGCPGIDDGISNKVIEANVNCLVDYSFIREEKRIELRMEGCAVETTAYENMDGSTIQRVVIEGAITKEVERVCWRR